MAKKGKSDKKGGANAPHIRNKRARHDYHISEKVEAGIELMGTEVKSIRAGGAKIEEAYVRIDGDQVYLVGANISPYKQAADGMQHDPTRKRRLLLHRRQIEQLRGHVQQKGKTLVPLSLYFSKGWAKIEVGVAEGKQKHDKRRDLKKRDHEREMQRAMRRNR
jgi:SsrA-binding protein